MKTRKFISRHRCHTIIFLLLLGSIAPLGCANGPKDNNLFSKVWGPDRVTFKEAVGLGDSPRKKKTDKQLASSQIKKTDPKKTTKTSKKSTKLARNERRTLRETFGGFSKVLFAGFSNTDKDEKSSRKLDTDKLKSKSLAADVRKDAKSDTQKSKPSGSLYASAKPVVDKPGVDKNDSANSFSKYLNKQKKSDQNRQEDQLAQSYNPFVGADEKESRNNSPRTPESDRDNRFVTEFDASWDQMKRNQPSDDDDDDLDEWDDDDDLDDEGERNPFEELASSKSEEGLPSLDDVPDWAQEASSQQKQQNVVQNKDSKVRVDRLLTHAKSELEAGHIDQALAIARYATDLADREGVTYAPGEESPGVLAQSIQDKVDNKIPHLEELPQDNAFVMSEEKQTPERNSRPEENNYVPDQNNQYPFADSEPSYQEQSPPEYNMAEAPVESEEYADLPNIEPLPPSGRSHYQEFEDYSTAQSDAFSAPRQEESYQEFQDLPEEEFAPPSLDDIQTEIVEVSDPYGGMIVDSEMVPDRIPGQRTESGSAPRTAIKESSQSTIRSADGQSTKYRYPKVPNQSILDRHKTWAPLPASTISLPKSTRTEPVRKNESTGTKANSHWTPSKSNRGNSIENKRKKVNSNRGANIITMDYRSASNPDNTWHSSDLVRSNRLTKVKSADLNVVETEAPKSPQEQDSNSEEITVVNHEQFFHMGGQAGGESQNALALGSWTDGGAGPDSESRVEVMRKRFLITICIVAAVILGIALRRRESLFLLIQKFSHR